MASHDRLVLDLHGHVLEAHGSLEEHSHKVAHAIFKILRDANGLLTTSSRPETFRRVTITTSDEGAFHATVTKSQILIEKHI